MDGKTTYYVDLTEKGLNLVRYFFRSLKMELKKAKSKT